jgi:hypothetical protein
MSLMGASEDVHKEVRLPTAPHRHLLREATLLHLRTTGPLRLRVKVHRLARMALVQVALVDSVVVVPGWEAPASEAQVVQVWVQVVEADSVAQVVQVWARVVEVDSVAQAVLAWVRVAKVDSVALAVLAWAKAVPVWARVVRACAVAHRQTGWRSGPSALIATAMVN